MIKQIAVRLIDIYQIIFSTFLKNLLGVNKFCRFEETCSTYAKRAILEKGLMQGSYLGFVRLIKCQPLSV